VIKKNMRRFLKRAFIPYMPNPGWNMDAVITLVGLGVWVIVTLGTAFGVVHQPLPEVQQIGSMLFGLGMGRASKSE
jgi:hypothetical protein